MGWYLTDTVGVVWKAHVLLSQPSHGQQGRGEPAKTRITQLIEDADCTLEEPQKTTAKTVNWRIYISEPKHA